MQMKAMNIKNLFLTATAFLACACVNEKIEDDTQNGTNMGVYFVEEQENAKTHTLEKGKDAASLDFIIRRVDDSEEASISYKFDVYYLTKEPLTDTSTVEVPVKADEVFQFGEIYFAPGQSETTLTVKFDNIKTGVTYHCSMYINDPKHTSAYDNNASSISFSVQMYEWTKLNGPALYRDALFSDMFDWGGRYLETEVDIYERKDKKHYHQQ